jgi:putative methyltransferase (TIGR04325 family)
MSLLSLPKRFFRVSPNKPVNPMAEVFKGNYSSWEQASLMCPGYGAMNIFEKTKQASLAVREGSALFERDSVLFQSEEYCWEVIAIMNSIAARNNGKLSILDFGGSLGSTYFQHKKLLNLLPEVRWCVVEQQHYVNFGKDNLEDDVLRFCATIEEAVEMNQPNVVLFGSVLQYLSSPEEQLNSVISQGIESIIIDRTAFHSGDKDCLTIQRVSPEIYDASYPAWFFSLHLFKEKLEGSGYKIVTEWLCEDDYPVIGFETSFRGMFFQRIK